MAVIFWISSLPNEQLVPEKGVGISISASFKHVVEFGLLGLLMANVVWQIKETPLFSTVAWGAFLFSSFYGILDEIHQGFTPTRFCTLDDMIVNMLGSFLGVVFFLILMIAYKRAHPEVPGL